MLVRCTNGNFYITNVATGNYSLQVSFLGYEEYTTQIEISADKALETIVLKETAQSLNEIEIVAKRPVLKKQQDRLRAEHRRSAMDTEQRLQKNEARTLLKLASTGILYCWQQQASEPLSLEHSLTDPGKNILY